MEQGLKGKLIQSKTIKTETDKIRYFLREYFLPFERLDLSYGWRAIQNAKRAHYLDVVDDKIKNMSIPDQTRVDILRNKISYMVSEFYPEFADRIWGI